MPASSDWHNPYLGAVASAFFAGCWIESFPIAISSPLSGGGVFAGKSGRKTPKLCETNAMETITIAAAHFMSGRFIRIQQHGKYNFFLVLVIKTGQQPM